MESKVCSYCKIDKSLSEYQVDITKKLGVKTYCKPCEAIYSKKYRAENKAKLLEQKKKYYQDNKEELKAKGKVYRKENIVAVKARVKKYYNENKEALKVSNLKAKAKYRHIIKNLVRGTKTCVLEITLQQYEELIADRTCHYCKESFAKEFGSNLDRINSDGGYTMDNVVPCCSDCNIMKFDLDDETIIRKHSKLIEVLKQRVAEKKNGLK